MERTKCNCIACKSGCTHKPGWMKFGDEKKMAEKMGITVKELFNKHLMVDVWMDGDMDTGKDIFVLSPSVLFQEAGTIFPFFPLGTCTFFKDGLCSIHETSPYECQHAHHTLGERASIALHRECLESWNNPEAQQLIVDLLGYEPKRRNPTLSDLLKFALL